MKVVDKYNKFKIEYSEKIVIIKSGIFFTTYEIDAKLINYLFGYKLENGKVGFPTSAIDKVKAVLEKKFIDYIIIIEETNDIKIFENNQYNNLYQKYKEIEYKDSLKSILFDRINFLLETNPNNYDKIRKFVDEL